MEKFNISYYWGDSREVPAVRGRRQNIFSNHNELKFTLNEAASREGLGPTSLRQWSWRGLDNLVTDARFLDVFDVKKLKTNERRRLLITVAVGHMTNTLEKISDQKVALMALDHQTEIVKIDEALMANDADTTSENRLGFAAQRLTELIEAGGESPQTSLKKSIVRNIISGTLLSDNAKLVVLALAGKGYVDPASTPAVFHEDMADLAIGLDYWSRPLGNTDCPFERADADHLNSILAHCRLI